MANKVIFSKHPCIFEKLSNDYITSVAVLSVNNLNKFAVCKTCLVNYSMAKDGLCVITKIPYKL